MCFGAVSLPVSLTACGDDSDSKPINYKAEFLHGVASGDPLQDRVIIWTRITVSDLALRAEVVWEVSLHEDFKTIYATGKVVTSAAADFTVKVDVTHLQADQQYFYRFKHGNVTSVVGQTKTLATHTDLVKFAVCSCSNYPAGLFHVYAEIAQQPDIDVVIHLGDYIYEYGSTGYASEDAKALGREFAENNRQEIISLDDYRRRYAIYRSDVNLQAAHQKFPFIVVWDDHELTNDTWREGAENHQANEGDFFQRKLAALQAYFEWMPIRPKSENDHFNIYRQFNFGQLVDLTMLDTRILGRDEQLDYVTYQTPTGVDFAGFQADLLQPTRTLLGYEQTDWLLQKLQQSQATWQVLGQQVLMSKILIPAELLAAVAAMDLGALKQKLTELVMIKARMAVGDPSVTAVERARVTTVAPYNLDAWDGYPVEREEILQTLKHLGKKAVVLAGDTHNAWYSNLYTQDKTQVAVEFATPAVSSPGIEYYLNVPPSEMSTLEMAFTTLVDELQYCNLSQRGYLTVSFTADEVKATWQYVDTVKAENYKIVESSNFSVVLNPMLSTPLPQTA